MRRNRLVTQVVALVVVGAWACASPALARDCPALVGHLPGPVSAVAVSGDYANLAGASGLVIADVSQPSAPRLVGEVGMRYGAVDIAVSGDYAYVAAADGLDVIDVSTPSTPVEVGFLDTGGAVGVVAVSGGYAYVAAGLRGFGVVDVSTPSAPRAVASILSGVAIHDVALSGDYAYVAASGPYGLLVVDVSTPSRPALVGSVSTATPGQSIAVSGGFAYLVGGGLLEVFDLSTPPSPVEVASIDTPGSAYDVAVSGGFAYVAAGDNFPFGGGGLSVIDVSTPSAPVEVGSVDVAPVGTIGFASDVAVWHGYAYVVGARGEQPSAIAGAVFVIDVSAPSTPVEVGWYQTGTELGLDELPPVGAVAVADEHVFLAAGEAGLYVFRECGPLADPRESFVPAAAYAAGSEGSFFQTDVELNNRGAEEAHVVVQWLPRGQDNPAPLESEPIALAPGNSVRFENVLTELFGLGPDSYGALKLEASTEEVIAMSRTSNLPAGGGAGTYGQGIPAIRSTDMIQGTESRRILFLSEDDDFRANVGCVNGSSEPVTVNLGVFDNAGTQLDTLTVELGSYGSDQVNRVLSEWAPVDGYVDVWASSDDAFFYCYGSMLDNVTSDPTTILPQVPSAATTFVPAAALSSGLEGSFFSTDVDLNNVGATNITYQLLWLPRWADNSAPVHSDTFLLAPGAGVRYGNVLAEVFGLEQDQVGALAVEASGVDLLAMSRTYNLPPGDAAGTFGQDLPGIPADRMIPTGVRKRIIFLAENDEVRSNVGCQNGGAEPVTVTIELLSSEGEPLETRTLDLGPFSNGQADRVLRDHAPIEAAYVDVWTDTPGATFTCYGSVLDNVTNDPTTTPPM